MTFRSFFYALFVLSLVASLLACSSSTDAPDDEHGKERTEAPGEDDLVPAEDPEPETDPFDTYLEDADESFDDRGDLASVQDAIESWNRALEDESADDRSDETIAEIYESIARAHHFIARYHHADGPVVDDDDDVTRHASRGLEAALKALRIRAPDFYTALHHGAPFEASIPDVDPTASNALLWVAKNLAIKTTTADVSAVVANTPVINAAMEFVAEHDPGAHYGAPCRYFAIQWLDRPFHRDVARSSQAFEDCLEAEPHFQLTRLLKAYYLTVEQENRDRFEDQLHTIVDSDVQSLPDAAPENRIVRQWAQQLLDRSDHLFD